MKLYGKGVKPKFCRNIVGIIINGFGEIVEHIQTFRSEQQPP